MPAPSPTEMLIDREVPEPDAGNVPKEMDATAVHTDSNINLNSEGGMQYTVAEVLSEPEEGSADGKEDDGVVSVSGIAVDGDGGYTVEEPITEGRLTQVNFWPYQAGTSVILNTTFLQEPDDDDRNNALKYSTSSHAPSGKSVFETDESGSQGTPWHSFPMPVSANPNVPDPTSLPRTPVRSARHTPPTLGSMPGTPHLLFTPHHTPGTPVPVSIPVPASILKVLRLQQSRTSPSTSGLFTPQNEEEPSAPSVVRAIVSEKRPPDLPSVSQQLHDADDDTPRATDVAAGDNSATPSITVTKSAAAIQPPTRLATNQEPADDPVAQPLDQDSQGLRSHPVRAGEQLSSETASANQEAFDENVEEVELRFPSVPPSDLASDWDSGAATELHWYFGIGDNVGTAVSDAGEGKIETVNETNTPLPMDEDNIGAEGSKGTSDHPTQPPVDTQTENDPFKLMGSDSAVAPGAVVEDSSSSAEALDDRSGNELPMEDMCDLKHWICDL
jgi:hypothetical protein